MKKVIDTDNMKILETFKKWDGEKMLARYRNMALWDNAEIDSEGDILLWNNK